MVSKQEILDLIRETAAMNNGQPLGQTAFRERTGIREGEWHSVFAARWSDLVREAGLQPNKKTSRISDRELVERLATLIRSAGHFPTSSERKMARRVLDDFPSDSTFGSRGGQRTLANLVVSELRGVPEYADVVEIVDKYLANLTEIATDVSISKPDLPTRTGFVYLIRDPRGCRIGQTTRAVGSRLAEHENQQGEAELLHRIVTDDPLGVERYWLRRFEEKRAGTSDHFNLSHSDIQAFKRWKKIW